MKLGTKKISIRRLRFKINWNWMGIRRVLVRFLLMFAASLLPSVILVGVVYSFLVYDNGSLTCSNREMISTLDKLYKLKVELVRERETRITEADYYDQYAVLQQHTEASMTSFVDEKTTRDLLIGEINAAMEEIDDYIADTKVCDDNTDHVYDRIDSIRQSIFGSNSSTQKS